MSERYDIGSQFETDGVFWEPGVPEERFSAHLSAAENIELSRGAELSGPQELFSLSHEKPTPRLLHGHTTLGPCTLIGLYELGGPRNLNLSTGEVLFARRFRVSVCIVGLHAADEETPEFTSATFSYEGLGDWLCSGTEISLSDGEIVIKHDRKQPPLLDFCVLSRRMRVQLRVASGLQWTPAGRHSAEIEQRILIEPFAAASLERVLDDASSAESFLCLWLGTSVRLRTVFLGNSTRKNGWVVRRQKRNTEEPDTQAMVRSNLSQLGMAIAAWFTTSEEPHPFEALVYGVVRNTPMPVEAEFLFLAQALESFHRVTDKATLEEPSLFRGTLALVQAAIRGVCQNPLLAERFEEATRFANEPSFKNRLESLLLRIDRPRSQAILGDLAEWEQTLRQTRNYFTHPGIEKRSRVLTGAKDLFLFNQRLHALLRLLLLLHLGLPIGLVFEPVLYQSGKWK